MRDYSVLPSSDLVYGVARYSGPANPVGNPGKVTRETAPLSKAAPARVMHPKLNTSPWSTSMAVKRTQPRSARRTRRKGYNGV